MTADNTLDNTLDKEAMAVAAVGEPAVRGSSTVSILAIDDMEENLYIIQQLLEGYMPNVEVLVTTDPEEGLQLAFEALPDVILLDYKMPVMSGISMCSMLKKDLRTSVIPVILITGHHITPEIRAEGLEAGADDFIMKPVNNAELIARIRVMLRIKRSEDELRRINQNLGRLVEEKSSSLAENEKILRQLTESIREVFWMVTPQWDHTFYVSPAYEEIWGRSLEEIHRDPRSWVGAVVEEDREAVIERIDNYEKDMCQGAVGPGEAIEYRIKRPDDTLRWIQTIAFPVFNEKNDVIRIAGISEDITERKRAEEKIKASLKEKDLLLKEIHHRVKNNMAVISSLLSLQSESFDDGRIVNAFMESQNRILSMALVHEKLYEAQDLSQIDFSEYIPDLVSQIFQSYEDRKTKINFQIDSRDIRIGIDAAIPCGLILNELVTNAIKYAFPEKRGGVIRISFSLDERGYCLTVSDNGVGMPESFNMNDISSFGLSLVKLLTQQLRGEMTIRSGDGTSAGILFPRRP